MKLDIQLFAASKSTTFSESNISIANNTSSLTINIWFSANNSTTWFQSATLYCTCNGSTQSANVSHAKGGSTGASFIFNNIAHNADGTKSVSWSWSCATGTTVLGTISDSGTQPLTTIARASQPSIRTYPNNSPNFDIGDTIFIHMNRQSSSFTHKVYFVYGNTNYLIAENVVNNCTFDTNLVANDLYNLIPTKNVYSNVIRVETYNGSSLIGTGTCNYNASITNANPIFNNFETEDVNNTTIALTDDPTINVNFYSNITATISTLNKASAQKGATMIKYRFVIGDKTLDINYDDENSVSGTIYNAPNGVYNVYAIDSRGNTTLVTKLASSEIAYTPITLDINNCSVGRNNNNSGDIAILKFQGSFWKQSFGLTTNNIQSITYQFKKTTSSTWITGTTTITPTINNDGTFEFEGQIASDNLDTKWDLQSAYDVKISVSDYLSTTQLQLTPLTSARPHICYADDGIGIMCDYDEILGGALQIEGEIYKKYNLDFSSSEVDTGRKWIDDKTIYRKVVTSSSLSSVSTGITNVDNMIKMNVLISNSNTGDWRPIPWLYADNNGYGASSWAGGVTFRNSDGALLFQTGIDLGDANKMIAIFEYTKTSI